MTEIPVAGALEPGGVPRPVPFRRVSAMLYALLAVMMAVGVGLAVHGLVRAVEDTGRALALKETAAEVVPAVLDLARGTAPMEAVTEPLREWVVAEAPDPAAAAAELVAVLAADDPGSPRAIAREIGDTFGSGDVDGPFLTAWLQLVLREDVEGAGESIANALAVNAGVELPRREVDDVFAVYLARAAGEEVSAEDLEAADALAARIAALPDAVSTLSIYVGTAVLILALIGAGIATGWLALRFARDAAKVWRTGRL
ncbi:MAG: hypothetical protein H6843_17965 [Rhodospirillaceae bacterium]|nr:hypothetical protein [Rhodospirillaceae bacterium]